jgi:hypothetical protein
MYRLQYKNPKEWVFVCKECLIYLKKTIHCIRMGELGNGDVASYNYKVLYNFRFRVYFSIKAFEILLLAILEAIKPKTVRVPITIKRLENRNSTGYGKL